MSLGLPAEPQCLGSHYLDKYICHTHTHQTHTHTHTKDSITALITLPCPWDNGWAGITRTQTSVSIHSSAKHQSLEQQLFSQSDTGSGLSRQRSLRAVTGVRFNGVSNRQLSQSDHIWIQALAQGNYGGQ